MEPTTRQGRSTVVRLLQFARAHWGWLLLTPLLTVLCVLVHVLAWAVAAYAQGAHVTGLTFWPTRSYGRVTFGSIRAYDVPSGDILSALAPYLAWMLIASIGIVVFAVRGRARSGFAERLLYILMGVLPVLSIMANVSTFISHAHTGGDAEALQDYRWVVAAVGLSVCILTVAIGWLRFKVAFSALLVRDYAIGWILLTAVVMLARGSPLIWSGFGAVAVREPGLFEPPSHDADWGVPASPTRSAFHVTAIHADAAGDVLVVADVANGTNETLYYFPHLHHVTFDEKTRTVVAMFGFVRPTARMGSSGEWHVRRPQFATLAPGESARLAGRVQPSFWVQRRTGGLPWLDVIHVDPASLNIVIKVAYSDKPLSLDGSNCRGWFECGRVLADLQRGVVTRRWVR